MGSQPIYYYDIDSAYHVYGHDMGKSIFFTVHMEGCSQK